MVFNFTNINKTNSHLSPEIIEQKTKDYELGRLRIHVLVWGWYSMWRVKPLMYVSYREIIKDYEMAVDVESFLVATMTCFVSQMTTDIFYFS